jgi:hypothetical protein
MRVGRWGGEILRVVGRVVKRQHIIYSMRGEFAILLQQGGNRKGRTVT